MDRELLGRRAAIDQERGDGGRRTVVDETIRASWDRCSRLLDASRTRRRSTPPTRSPSAGTPRRSGGPPRTSSSSSPTPAATPGCWRSSPTGRARCCGSRRRPSSCAAPRGSASSRAGSWDETAAGTNGIGMALVTGRPAAVFATEHWCSPVRDWVCYSAPVHAPDGSVAGVIDLSTTWNRANPLGLRMIGALARLIEVELAAGARLVAAPGLDSGRPRQDASDARRRPDRPQPSAARAAGRAGHRRRGDARRAARAAVRRPPDQPTTLRAEISHAARPVGGVIARGRTASPSRSGSTPRRARPPPLTATSTGAVERYDGALLPASDAPLIVERRYHLDVALRTALLPADRRRSSCASPTCTRPTSRCSSGPSPSPTRRPRASSAVRRPRRRHGRPRRVRGCPPSAPGVE